MAALFFGFAASMLGISGFESSANFVEEQAEGVFPKTLRNMWVAVSVLNPTLSLLALALVPIPDVAPNEEALLAHMGSIAAGEWLAWLISVDAILVLTERRRAHVLRRRDRAGAANDPGPVPAAVPAEEQSRAAAITASSSCSSASACRILFITEGELEALAGVYTLSFLAVMALSVRRRQRPCSRSSGPASPVPSGPPGRP